MKIFVDETEVELLFEKIQHNLDNKARSQARKVIREVLTAQQKIQESVEQDNWYQPSHNFED